MDTKEIFKKFILQSQTSTNIAFITEDQEITYQTFIFESIYLATYFQSQGLNQGDRIVVNLPNSIEFVYCYFACMVGRFTIIPINSNLTKNDINYVLEIVKPKLFIDNPKQVKTGKNLIPEIEIEYDFSDVFSIFFTSGTTSLPKGVCHNLGAMIANTLAFNKLVGLNKNTVIMHVLPMGYMAGFLNTILSPVMAGGTVVISPQFNAQQAIDFWQPAIKNNANTIWLTPTMAALLARLNRDKNITKWTEDNLINVFIGTAPLPKTVKNNFEKTFKTKCLESYGMTEVLIVASNALERDSKDYSVGLLLNDTEVETRGENNEILPRQETGQIYVKSPFSLKGYIDGNNEKNYSPLNNGWFATGDYGYIDNDNYLFITGRIKDLIIHGGTNISPRAVEEIILAHPQIKDVSIIGKPHPFWGEEVVAFLIIEDNQEFNQNTMREYCRQNLQSDAVPTTFKIINDFPRSSTGKIQKHLLQEML